MPLVEGGGTEVNMKKGIIAVLSSLVGVAVGAGTVQKVAMKKTIEQKENSDKHLALYLMMNQWVKVKQAGKSIPNFLLEKGYSKIAIYGMNYVGETLYDELRDSGLEIAYAIDKNADEIYAEIDVISPNTELDQVDAIIVTPIFFFDEIEEMLSGKTDADIICMEDILYAI